MVDWVQLFPGTKVGGVPENAVTLTVTVDCSRFTPWSLILKVTVYEPVELYVMA
jgi:hypothetical protein